MRNLLTPTDRYVYGPAPGAYNQSVTGKLHIGHVIRAARLSKKWNQTRLGEEAAKFITKPGQSAIDKSTVSKVETDPLSSELATVWRLIAALELTFADLEEEVGSPVVPAKSHSHRGRQTA
jgi:transcriptional regulator with XRE-family HTH domain